MKIWLDGKLVDEAEAQVSVFDHGVLYGDGCFEGIRFYSGKVFRLEEHIKRLFDSMRYLMLSLPWSFEEVCRATEETVAASGQQDSCPMLLLVQLLPLHGQSAFWHRIPPRGKNPSLDVIASLDMGPSSSNFDDSPTIVAVLQVSAMWHPPDATIAIVLCKDYSKPCAYSHLVHIPKPHEIASLLSNGLCQLQAKVHRLLLKHIVLCNRSVASRRVLDWSCSARFHSVPKYAHAHGGWYIPWPMP